MSLFNSILSFFSVPIIPIPKIQDSILISQITTKLLFIVVGSSNVFGKILNKIVIEKQVDSLVHRNLGTTLKVLLYLTETIEYYVNKKHPVYILLIDNDNDYAIKLPLDDSKAFDRLKLLNTLQVHDDCRVLYNMYTNSASKREACCFKCISSDE